ncbi:MAG: hypothetical protein KGH94_02145 [Candidatus Micrarchaeota archaeon]|nr:hypothetical protein [Candidatus Micrarchaeota archaeon]
MVYKQPRLGRKLIFEATLQEFRPDRMLEARLGNKFRSPEPNKKNIFMVAIRKVSEYSDRFARDDARSRGYSSFDEAQKSFFGRFLAELYTWPELFDWRRGFVSQMDAYDRMRLDKKSGKMVLHKGVDHALYELRDSGMTAAQVTAVTYNLFFNCPDAIKEAEPGRFRHFTPAAGFYAEHIKPNLDGLRVGADSRTRINSNMMMIIYLGMKREAGERAQENYKGAFRPEPMSKRERQMELLPNYRHLVEMVGGFDSPVPIDAVLDKIAVKDRENKPKLINRFATGLSQGRPCRDQLLRRQATS